jgi:hypothetical protein
MSVEREDVTDTVIRIWDNSDKSVHPDLNALVKYIARLEQAMDETGAWKQVSSSNE